MISNSPTVFAASSLVDILSPSTRSNGHTSGLLLKDFGLIIALGLILALLLVLWAKYFRKTQRRRHSEHRATKVADDSGEEVEGEESHHRGRRHKRRRLRREHRARNPTLAETGGLPPVRNDSPENPMH